MQRYLVDKKRADHRVWRFNLKLRTLPVGRTLRIETLAAAVVHWSHDGWATTADARSRDAGLGVHLADLPTIALPAGTVIQFTFYWPAAGTWEGTDFMLRVDGG